MSALHPRLPLRPTLLCLAIGLLAGCAGTSQQQASQPAPEQAAVAPPEPLEELPYKAFEAETLYALLVAEFAGSAERYDIALGNYVQEAHKTRDPGIAARATRIARYLNARQAALNTGLLWTELEPDNQEAIFIVATELIQSGQLIDALDYSLKLDNHSSDSLFHSIAAAAAQGSEEQRQQLTTRYRMLVRDQPDNAEMKVGLALLLQQQEQLNEALDLSRQALKQEPELIAAAILEARLLGQMGRPAEALKELAEMVNRHPDNPRLRLHYARLLASTDLEAAQSQFELLLAQSPDDPELLFSLALVCNERGDLEQAETHFQRLLEFPSRASSAQYYLGRIAEKRSQWELALSHYLQVSPGPDFMPAMLRTTEILVQADQRDLAHQRLESARQKFPEDAERFYLLEAEVLRQFEFYEDAERTLTRGLQAIPDSVQMRYSRAMIYERKGQIDKLEADLRAILEEDPDNATALNALGYTLADRTDRYEEALILIERALQLQPDEAAILDSLGWVHYRLGNYDEALLRLREALRAMPDPEVAAHLGEVLWATGQKKEAQVIWQQGLELQPGSPVILRTIERLQGGSP